MSDLRGKVAVVTGASKGIGAAIAKSLAEAGAAVVVNYASSKADADRVVGAITANGGKAIAVKGDVGKAADVQHLFDETRKQFGKLDVLVNNAGVYKFDPIEKITEEEFHRQFNTNVLGALLATREAVKHFGNGGGNVINISSVAATSSMAEGTVYAATKSALDTMTRTLASELGPRNIRVNAIAPGAVETEGVHAAGFAGQRLPEADHRRHAARPARPARRRRAGRGVPGVGRVRLDDRRAPAGLRRLPLTPSCPSRAGGASCSRLAKTGARRRSA